jgi:hypothetical protein
MLKILKLEAQQVSPSFITLIWHLESSSESFTDYHVDVYKGELPSTVITDYTLIASGISPQSHTSYNDFTISGMTNKEDTWNYCIRVINNNTGVYSTSIPIAINVQRDYVAKYIIKHRELVFNKLSGHDFFILKRKTYGTYCTACFDTTLQRTTNSKCPVCYDTRFIGGFYSPYRVRGQFNNNPPRHQLTTFGDWQDNDGILVMSNTPVVAPGDIIVDQFGKRWNVVTVKTTNKALFLISQQLQVRQIETDSVVYTIPISW